MRFRSATLNKERVPRDPLWSPLPRLAKGDKAEHCHFHPRWCCLAAWAAPSKIVLVPVFEEKLSTNENEDDKETDVVIMS